MAPVPALALLSLLLSSSEAFVGLERSFLTNVPRTSSSTLTTTASSVVRLQASSASNNNNGGSLDEDEIANERKARQEEISKRFEKGDALKRLRSDLDSLRENLQWAEATDDTTRIADLSNAIRNGEERDPEVIYAKSLRLIAETKAALDISNDDKQVLIERFQDRAQAARSHLPRFQLEGLWIGK